MEIALKQRTKNPLSGSFHRERNHVVSDAHNHRVEGEIGWLLLERDHGPNDDVLKTWICWGIDYASLADLVGWAHLRWTIE
jgi:hypothetical protein